MEFSSTESVAHSANLSGKWFKSPTGRPHSLAVYAAAEFGHAAVLEVLLKHGANHSTPMHDGSTPLSIASKGLSEGHRAVQGIAPYHSAAAAAAGAHFAKPKGLQTRTCCQANRDRDLLYFVDSPQMHE